LTVGTKGCRDGAGTGSAGNGCPSRPHHHNNAAVERWPTAEIGVAMRTGDRVACRRILETISRDPYGRIARQVEQLLSSADAPASSAIFKDVLAGARHDLDRQERADVMRMVHGLLTRSALSTAEFATRIGVSGSELEAFLTGVTCPSATMVLRMRRLTDRFARSWQSQRRPETGCVGGASGVGDQAVPTRPDGNAIRRSTAVAKGVRNPDGYPGWNLRQTAD
jgi:hypothetical protein